MKRFFSYLAALLLIASLSSCGYNNMIAKEEAVAAQWAQVENQYQRRADLVPNLVNTVKGAADFERGALTDVIEARAKATSIQVNADELNPEQIQQFQQAQEQLSGALSRLLVSVERYPELKANQNFLELQAQLEGTENRIAVERGRYNESVQDYNTYIRSFPQTITASWFDFEPKPRFEAREGSDVPPSVQF